MKHCQGCARELSTNEIGISYRLLGKDGKRLLCRDCLARELKVDPAIIDKKIDQYKKMGCPLFV